MQQGMGNSVSLCGTDDRLAPAGYKGAAVIVGGCLLTWAHDKSHARSRRGISTWPNSYAYNAWLDDLFSPLCGAPLL